MLIEVTTRTGRVEYPSILMIVRITSDDQGAIIQMLNGEQIHTLIEASTLYGWVNDRYRRP